MEKLMRDHQRLRCLVVRPATTGSGGQAGDEVVYRKTLAYLGRDVDLDIIEIKPIGKVRQILSLASGTPPECTKFMSRVNARALAERLRLNRYDVVLYLNEVSFPFLPQAKQAKVPAVLTAHNVHSLVARSDPSRLARALRPLALAFERKFYGDVAGAGLVCISKIDVQALRDAGVVRDDIRIAPPGAPPAADLAPNASVLAEAVLTGSYGWWRKRRDLTRFAEAGTLGIPILASDPVARDILGDAARPLTNDPGFWSLGLRFGLVTDSFVGGFKLKSLEYVAMNAVVLSFSDIFLEFEGLPHAAEFIRVVSSPAEARAIIDTMCADGSRSLMDRFITFKTACLERYAWDACLAPLREALAERAREGAPDISPALPLSV